MATPAPRRCPLARASRAMLLLLALPALLLVPLVRGVPVTLDEGVPVTPAAVTVPLQSLYNGAAWSVEVSIGTPRIPFGLYVDTGSSDLVVTEVGCTGCSPIGQKYAPSKSSTAHGVACDCGSASDPDCPYLCSSCVRDTCSDSVVYVTGDLRQVSDYQIYTDVVQCGPTVTRTAVGALYNMTDRPTLQARDVVPPRLHSHANRIHQRRLSSNRGSGSGGGGSGGQQDGVIGLGFPHISTSHAPNLVLSLAEAGVLQTAQFSITLNQSGGALALGGAGPFVSTATDDWLGWTPVTKQGFWQLPVHAVSLSGATLPVDPSAYKLAIVDTGTPTINLPSPAFAAFKTSLQASCSGPHPLPGVCDTTNGTSLFDGGCVSLSPDELAGFPTLSFHIDTATTTTTAPTKGSDVVLEIPPSAYLAAHWYACGPQGKRPYPMRGLTVVEEAGWTVLGGPVLQHFDTVFDMHGTGRVGWVRKPAAAAK